MPETDHTSTALKLRPANPTEIRQAVQEALARGYKPGAHNPAPRDRKVYNGAEIVVFAFEGTGEFDSRLSLVMQDAARALRQRGLTSAGSTPTLQYATFKALARISGQDPNWSGLATGPLESLLQDPELQTSTQWLSFPSEEYEALSRLTEIQKIPAGQLARLLLRMGPREAPGVAHALESLQTILAQAHSMGKRPHFVIVTHSSGIRSAIKFLERARDLSTSEREPLHFPFVLAIDPVADAHEVLSEALYDLGKNWLADKLNRLRGMLDALPLITVAQHSVEPVLVRHWPQPESLYVPANVVTSLCFFQRQDTVGLRMNPHFGIHGSPLKGAINYEIKQVGATGHSEISYHPIVTGSFVSQLRQLRNAP